MAIQLRDFRLRDFVFRLRDIRLRDFVFRLQLSDFFFQLQQGTVTIQVHKVTLSFDSGKVTLATQLCRSFDIATLRLSLWVFYNSNKKITHVPMAVSAPQGIIHACQ